MARIKCAGAMKITYDPEVDALFILLRDTRPYDSLDLEEGVTVALDEHGHIVGPRSWTPAKGLAPRP